MNDLLQFLKLSLLHVGYGKLDNKWNYKDVNSPFVRLFLVTKGKANADYKNQTFNLKEGYMYLIPSNTYNSYWCDDYHEQFYTGFFEEVKLGTSIFSLKTFNYEVKCIENDYKLFNRLLEINPNRSVLDDTPKAHLDKKLYTFNQLKHTALSYNVETQGILTILLSRFIKNTNRDGVKANSEEDMDSVLNFIAKHLGEAITIESLAKHYNLSADHFSRLFKTKYDISPNKYIQLKRIERAKFLLLTSKQSLKQIAENVGLGNMSYFSRKFKEITGSTPDKYRKQH